MLSGKNICIAVAAAVLAPAAGSLGAAEAVEEIRVIGVTPGSAAGREIGDLPFAVQSAGAGDLRDSGVLDISDYMNTRMAGVNINSAQNNPLQPDVQYRGFSASPLLGLPQGLAVWQDGVRINEPLGDAVNWDLLPESAIYRMNLISGANPVFGLNTLGGALAIEMKDGFNFRGNQAELYTGSWGRTVGHAESGGNNGEWGYYVNLSRFDEDGWRDLSRSEAANFYGSLSWRAGRGSALDLIFQQGDSELIGNGPLPVGLAALDRAAVFTAPDITENDLRMLNVDGSHTLANGIQLSGNAFWRENDTDSFNGDGSEFELCEFAGGAQALFEEADEVEDALEDRLGIELDHICEGEDEALTSFQDLQDYIGQQATLAGLDPEDFEIENVTGDLSGSGVLSDEAINNISRRVQESRGFNGQLSLDRNLGTLDNQLIVGVGWFEGESTFNSVVELAEMDRLTRSSRGLGVGTFFDEAETDIHTETETLSLFFTDTLELSDRLALTLAGRWNDSDIVLRDRSGERPELNGDHGFSRFNPSLGFSYDVDDDVNVYGSYSESNRVPTPIELACNEGVFELARQFAVEEGEDPDDIEFECRLPNAFLADPPLEDVVTRNVELGSRGVFQGLDYQVGLFHAVNENDIIFQTTGRATGLFANVDETRRWGFEGMLRGSMEQFDWYASYSYIRAEFGDDFTVLSPNHPNADAEGELAVQSGDRLPGLPESIFKLGGDWHFSAAFSVGAEALYNSNQVVRGDESNDLARIDGYTLVNLRGSYRLGEHFSLFGRVTNLFDEEYANFGLLGENPGEILELEDDRPLFLGIGAPRGAWVGLRLNF